MERSSHDISSTNILVEPSLKSQQRTVCRVPPALFAAAADTEPDLEAGRKVGVVMLWIATFHVRAVIGCVIALGALVRYGPGNNRVRG